jgi:hypothetical protein
LPHPAVPLSLQEHESVRILILPEKHIKGRVKTSLLLIIGKSAFSKNCQ